LGHVTDEFAEIFIIQINGEVAVSELGSEHVMKALMTALTVWRQQVRSLIYGQRESYVLGLAGHKRIAFLCSNMKHEQHRNVESKFTFS
jgi:hypothetical protein